MAKKSIKQFDEKNDEQVYVSVHETLESARGKVERAVNSAMVEAYWEIGRQIVEATGERAEYGKHLLQYRVREGLYGEELAPDAFFLSGVSNSAHIVCRIELVNLSASDAYTRPRAA